MSEHTQGPWEHHAILSNSENDKGFRVMAHDGRDGRMWIADVSPVINNERGETSEEGKANARLIAAAPELLEALVAAVNYLSRLPPFPDRGVDVEAVRLLGVAAIAKAEGR